MLKTPKNLKFNIINSKKSMMDMDSYNFRLTKLGNGYIICIYYEKSLPAEN